MRIESRSRAIASARETITIARVRAPHKGGGPRKFDIGEQSQATPSPRAENDHSRVAKPTHAPLLPPFADPAPGRKSRATGAARRRDARRAATRRYGAAVGVAVGSGVASGVA